MLSVHHLTATARQERDARAFWCASMGGLAVISLFRAALRRHRAHCHSRAALRRRRAHCHSPRRSSTPPGTPTLPHCSLRRHRAHCPPCPKLSHSAATAAGSHCPPFATGSRTAPQPPRVHTAPCPKLSQLQREISAPLRGSLLTSSTAARDQRPCEAHSSPAPRQPRRW